MRGNSPMKSIITKKGYGVIVQYDITMETGMIEIESKFQETYIPFEEIFRLVNKYG